MGRKIGTCEAANLEGLLRRARAGDTRAQNDLLAALRPYLKGLAERNLDLRLRGRMDASDLVQEVLAEGSKGLPRFVGSSLGELLAYFGRILQRNVIDARRAQLGASCRSVATERSLDEDRGAGSLQDRLAAQATSPSQATVRSQNMARLLDAMRRLPDRQREALRLHQAGHSHQEIGAHLGCTASAAQSLVKHAHQWLKDELKDEDPSG